MHQSLSGFMRHQAELATDGRIPAQTKAEIAIVMCAERAYERHIGKVEATRQSMHAAMAEVADRAADFRACDEQLTRNPSDPALKEMVARARAELIDASNWLDQCNLEFRKAIRQSAADAVQAGGATSGRAA